MGIAWALKRIAIPFLPVQFRPMPPFSRLSGRLRYHPEWQPEYMVRDGKRVGPFLWSTEWTRVDKVEGQIFGVGAQAFREKLKSAATNKAYQPPENPVHLARDVIRHLDGEANRWRSEAIEARKELSALRRAKG